MQNKKFVSFVLSMLHGNTYFSNVKKKKAIMPTLLNYVLVINEDTFKELHKNK